MCFVQPGVAGNIRNEEELTQFLQKVHTETAVYLYRGLGIITGLFNHSENVVSPYYCIDIGKAKVTLYCNGDIQSVRDTIAVINSLPIIGVPRNDKPSAEAIMDRIDRVPKGNMYIINNGFRYLFYHGREYSPEEVMERKYKITWMTTEHWTVVKESNSGTEERKVFLNRNEAIAFIESLLDDNLQSVGTFRSS